MNEEWLPKLMGELITINARIAKEKAKGESLLAAVGDSTDRLHELYLKREEIEDKNLNVD